MTFPVFRSKEFESLPSRNRTNKYKREIKDKYLDEDFRVCPKCKKQDLIEVAKILNNKIIDFCLSCGYKKRKGKIK